ncbi:UNVERIFIED_CONTAM: hypothetical protein FKN15_057049 [Acipenser sinensis]
MGHVKSTQPTATFPKSFLLLGASFLAIGLWAWAEKGVLSNISSITDLGGFDPVWLFMVVGAVMFILGFAGCIGALRENTHLLKFFSVFLGLIFFLELTAGILAFVFKDWIKDQLNFFINNNVKAYRDDIDLQNLIDFAQEYNIGSFVELQDDVVLVQCLADSIEGNGFTVSKGDQEASHKPAKALLYKRSQAVGGTSFKGFVDMMSMEDYIFGKRVDTDCLTAISSIKRQPIYFYER